MARHTATANAARIPSAAPPTPALSASLVTTDFPTAPTRTARIREPLWAVAKSNSNLMNTLQKYVADSAANLTLAQAFADKFGDKLPKEVAAIHGVNCFGAPECSISTGYYPDDRLRALSLVGDVFGRDGWKRLKDYGNETFSWSKTVDGVRVLVPRVENIEIPLNDSPVPVNAFPLQLAETTTEALS